MSALGLDLGSTTAKAVVLDASGAVTWAIVEPAEPRGDLQAARLREQAQAAGLPPGAPCVATGYGRRLVVGARPVTEVTCHARGAAWLHPGLRTLLDLGGQDTKAIRLAPDGTVQDFAMNDKCAAGTGRFLEVTATRLRLDLEAFARAALAGPREVPVSSTCTVFAESEVVSLLARGEDLEAVVRGLHRAMVRRVAALARSVGVVPPVAISGGVARNPAVVRLLAEELGTAVQVLDAPDRVGALGAALLARGP